MGKPLLLAVRRCHAALAPVKPEPMMTMSALVGRFLVERWAVSKGEGWECQKEDVDFSEGRPAGECWVGRSGCWRDIVGVDRPGMEEGIGTEEMWGVSWRGEEVGESDRDGCRYARPNLPRIASRWGSKLPR